MPPAQCPHCGRFLKQALVDALAAEPAPCPRCEAPLRAEDFATSAAEPAEHPAPVATAAEPADRPTVATAAEPAEHPTVADQPTAVASVRPPDLVPDEVRDDVLAGWDAGESAMFSGAGRDEPPFPTDTVVVASAAVAGAIAGALLDRRRGRGALLGGLVAAILAAVARQIWRLEA